MSDVAAAPDFDEGDANAGDAGDGGAPPPPR